MTYKTDNIAVAAALRVFGHQVKHIGLDGRKATFTFDEEVSIEAEDIFLGKKLVDAISFHQELRRLSGLARTMSQSAGSTTVYPKVN